MQGSAKPPPSTDHPLTGSHQSAPSPDLWRRSQPRRPVSAVRCGGARCVRRGSGPSPSSRCWAAAGARWGHRRGGGGRAKLRQGGQCQVNRVRMWINGSGSRSAGCGSRSRLAGCGSRSRLAGFGSSWIGGGEYKGDKGRRVDRSTLARSTTYIADPAAIINGCALLHQRLRWELLLVTHTAAR